MQYIISNFLLEYEQTLPTIFVGPFKHFHAIVQAFLFSFFFSTVRFVLRQPAQCTNPLLLKVEDLRKK